MGWTGTLKVIQPKRGQLQFNRPLVRDDGFRIYGLTAVGVKLTQSQVVKLGLGAGARIKRTCLGNSTFRKNALLLLIGNRLAGSHSNVNTTLVTYRWEIRRNDFHDGDITTLKRKLSYTHEGLG